LASFARLAPLLIPAATNFARLALPLLPAALLFDVLMPHHIGSLIMSLVCHFAKSPTSETQPTRSAYASAEDHPFSIARPKNTGNFISAGCIVAVLLLVSIYLMRLRLDSPSFAAIPLVCPATM
jgi:hypothetical protein